MIKISNEDIDDFGMFFGGLSIIIMILSGIVMLFSLMDYDNGYDGVRQFSQETNIKIMTYSGIIFIIGLSLFIINIFILDYIYDKKAMK